MGNKPEEDIQVENETVEPYRGIMIFRTLQKGEIVGLDGTKSVKAFPKQTFYALLDEKTIEAHRSQANNAAKSGILVGGDVESVRFQIDQAVPGTGLIIGETEGSPEAEEAKSAAAKESKSNAEKVSKEG